MILCALVFIMGQLNKMARITGDANIFSVSNIVATCLFIFCGAVVWHSYKSSTKKDKVDQGSRK